MPAAQPADRAAPRRRAGRSAVSLQPGRRLLEHDRTLGVRLVAGADEAGRGALAGPLVCAAVLLDLAALTGPRGEALDDLYDSKQVTAAARERLYDAVLAAAPAVAIRVVPAAEIDRAGLHRSNIDGLAACLAQVAPPAGACLVDGFRVGLRAPDHTAIRHGDTVSAAIAAASIVAKVTRDRLMQRLDAAHPAYGFAGHVGYITAAHAAAVRAHGPCAQHRRSFDAACYR